MSLKQKPEGYELDLSLNQLSEVPIKELAAAKKANCLDLSCNHLRTLPREFATFTNLVKIDLSSNSLEELPDNFGNLQNLQHLDLYSNKLVILPTSFCRLKNLRWLDLKTNPLDSRLKEVAGDCLSEKDCQACAKKVVAFMQTLDSNLERGRQKKLKEAREREAKLKEEIEKQMEVNRLMRKAMKDQRKAEAKAKKAKLLFEQQQKVEDENYSRLKDRTQTQQTDSQNSRGLYFFTKYFVLFLLLLCGLMYSYEMWRDYLPSISKENLRISAQRAFMNGKLYTEKFFKLVNNNLPMVKESILKIIHQYMVIMTNFATEAERLLSQYF